MANFQFGITTKDLDGTKVLQDGDTIKMKIDQGAPSDKLALSLRTTDSNWWKALLLFNGDSGDFVSLAEVQAAHGASTGVIDSAQLAGNHLVLSKAKAFGVHTNVYWIKDAVEVFRNGQIVSFVWERDR